ncbi:nucleotide-diphospho-sugar transferase [Xylariales sp. PMI_506]|nr:nucleotide-diphospho-sugar transferase [Xylariales sp. PMI_506]
MNTNGEFALASESQTPLLSDGFESDDEQNEKVASWQAVEAFKPSSPRMKWAMSTACLSLLVTVFTIWTLFFRPSNGSRAFVGSSGIPAFPNSGSNIVLPRVDPCFLCNCSAAIPYYSPPEYITSLPRRPEVQDVRRARSSAAVNGFIQRTIFDIYCAQAHLNVDQTKSLMRSATRSTERVMAWSLVNLQLDKPTIYLTTATSPNGKANPYRPQYIQRHARSIMQWFGSEDRWAQPDQWQAIWILVEDDVEIDPLVALTLRSLGIPFIYFAYGQTNSWGNAQKNAAMEMVYALSRPRPRGLFGHGPVYGMDDDNEIAPNLLGMLTKLIRLGVFDVGMAKSDGTVDFWEGPIVNNDGVITGSTGPPGRKFSLDYGAFAYNSSVLGSYLKGPYFWDFKGWAGETEFLERMVDKYSQLEPLCWKYKGPKADCHFVAHNKPLEVADYRLQDLQVSELQKALFLGKDKEKRNLL